MKCQKVALSEGLIRDLCTKGHEAHYAVVEGLPEGAELVNSYYDPPSQCAYLIYYHPSFPDIPYGCPVPLLDVMSQDLYTLYINAVRGEAWRALEEAKAICTELMEERDAARTALAATAGLSVARMLVRQILEEQRREPDVDVAWGDDEDL